MSEPKTTQELFDVGKLADATFADYQRAIQISEENDRAPRLNVEVYAPAAELGAAYAAMGQFIAANEEIVSGGQLHTLVRKR